MASSLGRCEERVAFVSRDVVSFNKSVCQGHVRKGALVSLFAFS